MLEYGHFIGGKTVKGTAGRFGDVFQPMDRRGARQGRRWPPRPRCAAAVENAKAAQPAWAATNPQRRARVLMKFLELANRDYDKLADCLAREHGKTIADAKGDIQRGAGGGGVRHAASRTCMKGEYTEGAGPGIDIYSMRQPLGVVAGITPFNFPAMIPMWKFAPAIACGNAFILKPSERDPGVPLMLAELMIEAGLPRRHPQRRQRRQGGGRRHPRPSRHPGHRLRRLDADRRVHLRARLRGGQARAVLRRRQEPHDRHARRRHGPGRRRADRRRLRLGRRALHGGLGGGAGRPEDGRHAGREADPARGEPEDRPLDRPAMPTSARW